MNRKWLVGGVAAFLAIAAVLALVLGDVIGRSIVPSPAGPEPPAAQPAPTPKPPSTVRFTDTLTDVSIAYPARWKRPFSRDPGVRLLAVSSDASAAVKISVRKSGLDTITMDTLPLVRALTDDLVSQNEGIGAVPEPAAVTVDRLPGYRYTYTYRRAGGGDGAHIHYFLFKDGRLIQMVLESVPAARLRELQSTFDDIARTFRSGRG